MRNAALAVLAGLLTMTACSTETAAPEPLRPLLSHYASQSLTLVDETGAPLPQTAVQYRYRCGGTWMGWYDVTTGTAGDFAFMPACVSDNWDNKVSVSFNMSSLEQNVTLNPTFQAALVRANLMSCTGPILAAAGSGGTVHLGLSGWPSIGKTGTTGTLEFHAFPGSNINLRMHYQGPRTQKDGIPVVLPVTEVDFPTTRVTLSHPNAIRSNSGDPGGWWNFAKPSMDLLPAGYNFQFHTGTTWGPDVPLVISGCEFVYPAASDNAPPVVANVAVSPNPAPFTTTSYALTATATDNEAVTTASYTIDGGAPVSFAAFSPGTPVSLAATLGALGVGVYDVCVTAEDAAGNDSNPACTELTVTDNQAPVVTNVAVSPNPAPFTTASYALTATATDNEAVTAASYTIDAGAPVSFVFSPGTPVSLAATLGAVGVGVYAVCVTAEDAAGNDSDPACTTLTVTDNLAPVVTNVAVSPNPAPNTTLNYTLTAHATDNVGVTTASYTIGEGNSVAFSGFSPGSSVSLSATLDPLDVGVYDICVTAKDAANNTSNTECTMLAVYDPSAGFVTGGGWINSPAGAYALDAELTGKATFGFVSKYLKGSSVPTGNTQFQFKAGDLNFSSTSYEWLVVSGARAQFKGAGTINGTGDYRFMLTAIDGQINGGGGTDKFRIRIWNNDGGGLVYDNLLNAPDTDDPTTVLGGGNIVIHVPKK